LEGGHLLLGFEHIPKAAGQLFESTGRRVCFWTKRAHFNQGGDNQTFGDKTMIDVAHNSLGRQVSEKYWMRMVPGHPLLFISYSVYISNSKQTA
jgi:hypothetical protein